MPQDIDSYSRIYISWRGISTSLGKWGLKPNTRQNRNCFDGRTGYGRWRIAIDRPLKHSRNQDADEILVLDEGRVVERGGHRALLDLGRVYAGMWARQQEAQEARVALERAGEFPILDDGAAAPAK